jgi:hypothetical protein
MRMLRYSSSRFQPRINDYSYPQRRARRMTAGQRAWRDLAWPDARTDAPHLVGAEVTR